MICLNSLCRCFYFWDNHDDNIELINASQADLNKNDVFLDVSRAGQEVVIVKNGKRLCGTGGVLSNVPIIQNKAYFEIKIQAKGFFTSFNLFLEF
jgi:hypothetical protein